MRTEAADRTTTLPTGTWTSDLVHSSIVFRARHMMVSTFRGELPRFDVTVEDGTLTGTAPVSAIVTRDEKLTGHLASPDFFDAEHHPEVTYRSTATRVEGDALVMDGELTIKGISHPLTLRGSVTGPHEDPFGLQRIGIDLHGSIDRRDFSMNWQADLPGGGVVLGNDVALAAQIELVERS